MMNENRRKNLPLFLIILGSILLAVPASVGTYFLIGFAIDMLKGRNEGLAWLLPVALIGYFLLFGYFWTVWTKRFVRWFWIISMSYNLLITLVSAIFIVQIGFNIIKSYPQPDGLSWLLTILFPIWTLFVTIASAKYAFYKPTDKDLNLP